MNDREFEIHCAAQAGGHVDDLRDALTALGFRDDALHGGVVFPPRTPPQTSCPLTALHATWDTRSRREYLQMKEAVTMLLERADADGYAHAEVIRPSWDIDLVFRPFDPEVASQLPRFGCVFDNGPKRWDVHVSLQLDTVDARLQERLVDYAGMYFIDLPKAAGLYRVFTIQGTTTPRAGFALFTQLRTYLEHAGGATGAIKFEQTCWFRVFGRPAIIPPTVEVVG